MTRKKQGVDWVPGTLALSQIEKEDWATDSKNKCGKLGRKSG